MNRDGPKLKLYIDVLNEMSTLGKSVAPQLSIYNNVYQTQSIYGGVNSLRLGGLRMSIPYLEYINNYGIYASK